MQLSLILVIDMLPRDVMAAVRSLRTVPGFTRHGILLVTRRPELYVRRITENADVPVEVVACQYENEFEIEGVIKPFQSQIAVVICRSDQRIQFLRKVIPYLPPSVLVSSSDALAIATNKRRMREAFAATYPEISPRFVHVRDDTDEAVRKVKDALSFPVIVKPANLASSLLIQRCNSPLELQAALQALSQTIKMVYTREERSDAPEIIVEEYLQGHFYSIDAYAMERDRLFYCPPVPYLPATEIGVDDFSLFKRFLPASLTAEEIAAANETVRKAVSAAGLVYTSVHAELVQTSSGWKVIEIGPRLGNYRPIMYKLGYGIDHELNDLRIRVGLEPVIPTSLQQYVATYTLYPREEGILQEIRGLDILRTDKRIVWSRVRGRPGEESKFAKHGGQALAEFVVAAPNEKEYQSASQMVETEIYPIIRPL